MVIAASALILKGKKIFLVKRSDYTDVFPLHWGAPGGRAEGDETAKQVVVREVKEETSLEFKPAKLFFRSSYKDRDRHQFFGEWSGEVKLQDEELTDWNWFSYEEALKLDLAFDYREVIKKLRKEKYL